VLGVCISYTDVQDLQLMSTAAKVIIHDMEVRGSVILDTVLLRPEAQEAWRQLFDAAVNSQIRIWVAIAAV
jgi:hypothetical protein